MSTLRERGAAAALQRHRILPPDSSPNWLAAGPAAALRQVVGLAYCESILVPRRLRRTVRVGFEVSAEPDHRGWMHLGTRSGESGSARRADDDVPELLRRLGHQGRRDLETVRPGFGPVAA